jgi:hypothetical protein
MELNTTEPKPAELTARHDKAIAALLTEPSVKKAAAAAGIGEATIWRWLRDDQFRKAYLVARRRLVQQATARIQQFASEAAAVLHSIMTDKSLPATARVAAAKAVLQNAYDGVDLEDNLERVSDIEKMLAEVEGGPKY